MKTSACYSHRKRKRLTEFLIHVDVRLCCKGDEFGSEAKLQVRSLPGVLVLVQWLCVAVNGSFWELRFLK